MRNGSQRFKASLFRSLPNQIRMHHWRRTGWEGEACPTNNFACPTSISGIGMARTFVVVVAVVY